MQTSLSQAEALVTLEDVRARFEHWRIIRRRPNEKIPDALKADAASLIGRYPKLDIMKRLKLDNRQLKSIQHLRGLTSPLSQPSAPPEIPVFMGVALPSVSPCSAELHHPNGMKLCLQAMNEQQLSSVVQTFMTNASCCR